MTLTEIAKGTEGTSVHLQIRFGRNGSMALNLFGPTVKQVLDEATELGDSGPMLVAIAETFQGLATVAEVIPGTTVVTDPNAKVCAHGVARVRKSGGEGKKAWVGYFCDVKNDPNLKQCAVEWENNK